MLVLDYPKKTSIEEPSIIVPPFHTGHLGFVPGTDVVVGLVRPGRLRSADAELAITPFSQQDDMAVLTAVMRDRVGVVERLVRAVADLDVNIEAEESSSIAYLNEHSVTLVCDISRLEGDRSPRDSGNYLTDYVHTQDPRLLQLVENVLLHCAGELAWKDERAPRLALDVRMLAGRQIQLSAPVTLARAPHNAVSIALPDNVADGVLKAQRDPNVDCLDYIFVSDTDDRSLRVYFLPATAAAKVYHVGLVHADRPGALAALLQLTAAAKFNILTSLVRKETVSYQGRGRSVWEAVLEYRGDSPQPHAEAGPPSEWIRDRLAAAAKNDLHHIESFDIAVRAPSYPKPATPSNSEVPKAMPLTPKSDKRRVPVPRTSPPAAMGEMLRNQRAALHGLPSESQERRYLKALLDAIESRTRAPRIFLSYPFAAKDHAAVLRTALEEQDRFSVVTHDQQDGKPIVGRVVEKIIGCEHFIGLWHHEELPIAEGGGHTISPWMHFEYGIALANHKESIIVHSNKLPEKLWKRINPGISHPEYSDLTFISDTVPLIVAHCMEHFAVETGAVS